jgi:hypothetical protein
MILDPMGRASWHGYRSSPEFDPGDHAYFEAALHRPGVRHLYPPPVFDQECARDVAALSTELVRLLFSIPSRVFNDDLAAWSAFLGVPAPDRDLLLRLGRSTRFRTMATSFARPDLLVTDHGLRLVEINVSTPMGGMNCHDPYLRQVRGTTYSRYLTSRGLAIGGPEMAPAWADVLRSLIRLSDRGRRPLLFEGIANPRDPDSGRRFFVALAARAGVDVVSGTMAELDLRGDGVFHNGRRIDSIFTMYTWGEARAHVPHALTAALAEADEAGLVDFIAPPLSALYDNKANLEILSSPEFRDCFTAEEQRVLAARVPETLRLTPARLDGARARRAALVLKPAAEYGGRGVVFGASCTPDEWSAALASCLADRDNPHVLQELVDDPWAWRRNEPDDGGVYEMVLGPMVFGGRYAGTSVRASLRTDHRSVINVARGAEVGALLTRVGAGGAVR